MIGKVDAVSHDVRPAETEAEFMTSTLWNWLTGRGRKAKSELLKNRAAVRRPIEALVLTGFRITVAVPALK